MVCVSGNTFQRIQQGLFQRANILVNIQSGDKIDLHTLLGKAVNRISRGKRSCRMIKIGFTTCIRNFFLQSVTQLNSLADHNYKTFRVKINIGQGGENSLHGEAVYAVIDNPLLPCLIGKEGHTAECVDKHIFKISYFFVLAAYADFGTGDTFCSLFTLVAIHGKAPWFIFVLSCLFLLCV